MEIQRGKRRASILESGSGLFLSLPIRPIPDEGGGCLITVGMDNVGGRELEGKAVSGQWERGEEARESRYRCSLLSTFSGKKAGGESRGRVRVRQKAGGVGRCGKTALILPNSLFSLLKSSASSQIPVIRTPRFRIYSLRKKGKLKYLYSSSLFSDSLTEINAD